MKAANRFRAVLDTNILISGLLYDGKPESLLRMIYEGKVNAVTSEVLILELKRVLNEKFNVAAARMAEIELQLRDSFEVVESASTRMKIVKDEADNRVLETAIAGECGYIVTGDKLLLSLNRYKDIKIISVNEFLRLSN